MALISKTYRFEAAHQLIGHKGQCANLHGHSYVMEVRLQGPIKKAFPGYPDSDDGMVIDFSDINDFVKPMIDDHLDHRCLNDLPDILRPTAERLACWAFGYLRWEGLQVHSVVLHETHSSYVQVFEQDWRESGLWPQ